MSRPDVEQDDLRERIAVALAEIERSDRGFSDGAVWGRNAVTVLCTLDVTQAAAHGTDHTPEEAADIVTDTALTRVSGDIAAIARVLYGMRQAHSHGRIRSERRRHARRLYAKDVGFWRSFISFRQATQGIHMAVAESIVALELEANDQPGPQLPGRSGSIGVIAPLSSWYTSYHVDLVRELHNAAYREPAAARRRPVVFDVPRDDLAQLEPILADPVTLQMSALIIVNAGLPDAAREALISRRIPVALINDEDPDPPVVCNVLSDQSGFENLLHHAIIERESRSALLVTKRVDMSATDAKPRRLDAGAERRRLEKREIFERMAQEAGLRPLPSTSIDRVATARIEPGVSLIVEVDHYRETYGRILFERVAHLLPPDTCICFLADVVALAFQRACDVSGRTCEARRLRITGFDNTAYAKSMDLSSVDYRLDQIARLAYDRVQAAIGGDSWSPHAPEIVRTLDQVRRSSDW